MVTYVNCVGSGFANDPAALYELLCSLLKAFKSMSWALLC